MLSAVLVFVLYNSIHERIIVVGDSAPEFTITADNGRKITRELWRASAGIKFLGYLVPAVCRRSALSR